MGAGFGREKPLTRPWRATLSPGERAGFQMRGATAASLSPRERARKEEAEGRRMGIGLDRARDSGVDGGGNSEAPSGDCIM